MVHVRGNGCDALDITNGSLPLPLRKSKGNAVEVSPSESVVNLALQSLEVPAVAEAVRNINTDEVTPVPPELRLPQKHFESGTKLQARILPQLKTVKKRPDSHRVSVVDSKDRVRAPPHLARLYASIASSLSAFDMFQCETTNWAQKYAPSKASGSGKKKRRKKLDGFIVSSDDEDDALCELSDEEDDWAPSGSRGITRKTVVRSGSLRRGKDDDRAANALVISGPHGCGKTAAVYAVAKELDFEVFEINPGGRRSGKDVLEKIGATADDDTVKDIKSGKQATMNAFFRPSSARDKPKMPAKAAANSLQAKAKKDSPITQRQSLILLEEVDILYEEDKQFWATVVGLIAQSKRPFIMTCNDETLVPLHTLKLHGIFRLSPPPRDLAVDRLILIAANEGHALTRQSVEQVFDSRKSDLRAATMDLQYWCQMGIGDRKGGLDWYYPRWPKGVDLDENNEVIRVVSQDTYRLGMNLLGRDSITDPKLSPRLIEEEILRQAWDSWALDLGHWQDTIGLGDWAQSVEQNTGHGSKLGSLRAYEDAADAMSAADLCSSKAFAAFTEEAVDPTQPEIPATIRDDFVLGQTYIDTTPIEHFDSLTTSISLTIKSLARSSLQLYAEGQQETSLPLLPPLDETTAINLLQTSFKSTPPGTPVISRIDFAFAFDPIAAAPGASLQPASYLEPSVFDRTLKLIALDVAPFVRGIVSYEAQLQKQRLKLSNLG
ncbi:72b880a0-2789-4716-ad25-c2cf367ee977 [Thermothielavioides terrestris]|uniref:72b880a0-2789-4716-ad25-c2cf367ee977 n=1 Tax=Thermothielavioides terrestris TaxID=2587410 RepID=A0A3S4BAA4_9PEZI|nr:72b880a0-2789-4716-ad25-c2cf367ee977 [Thermothielavioides terrestris]